MIEVFARNRICGLRCRAFVTPFVLLALAGCSDNDQKVVLVDEVSISLNPYNNLSTQVSFRSIGAESARVIYEAESGERGATPFQTVSDGSNSITTLGLAPETVYRHTIETRTAKTLDSHDAGEYRSGALPEPLQEAFAPEVSGALTHDYVLLAIGSFALAFDETGQVRWYREVEGLMGLDVGQKGNGNYVAFVGETTGFEMLPGYYIEFEPSGEYVRQYNAPDGLFMDNHELLLTDFSAPTPTAHFFTILQEERDLSSLGGSATSQIVGHQIIRMKDGEVDFRWDALDHLSVEGAGIAIKDYLERCARVCDYDHPNSLHIDADGNYVVSWAMLSEITKVNSVTGEVMWRLGGVFNEFEFVGDPLNGFSGQHCARTLDNGNVLLFDNGTLHQDAGSRAVEYRLDLDAMTATMVWEFRLDPPLFSEIVGSAVRLYNGNTLIGFTGNVDLRGREDEPKRIVEVTASGTIVWDSTLITPGFAYYYRALPLPSLYEYLAP